MRIVYYALNIREIHVLTPCVSVRIAVNAVGKTPVVNHERDIKRGGNQPESVKIHIGISVHFRGIFMYLVSQVALFYYQVLWKIVGSAIIGMEHFIVFNEFSN